MRSEEGRKGMCLRLKKKKWVEKCRNTNKSVKNKRVKNWRLKKVKGQKKQKKLWEVGVRYFSHSLAMLQVREKHKVHKLRRGGEIRNQGKCQNVRKKG